MKPTVMASGPGGAAAGATAASGVGATVPTNHDYGTQQQQQQQPRHQQQQPYSHYQTQSQPQQHQFADPSSGTGYDASSSGGRQFPAQFQPGFAFEPDMDDMDDMFSRSRSRLGRIHDPFSGFGARERCGNDAPAAATDGFSHYFKDDPDFEFPQFGTLGRRRAGTGQPVNPHATRGRDEHDFFNRLPAEFRQYIPDSFAHSRRSSAAPPTQSQAYYTPQAPPPQQPQHQQQQQHPQYYPQSNGGAQSPSKRLCDAAIQTEERANSGGASGVDQQRSMRNTVDLGIKSSMPLGEEQMYRAHSAPPSEQQPQQRQMNGKRHTPPLAAQYDTQTGPQGMSPQQAPFQKVYYAPQQQMHTHVQQKQEPAPSTPGGSYVRTIPIFVEGRSEPIINSHKEIPNQNAAAASAPGVNTANAERTHAPNAAQQQQQSQYRPAPLNTQQQQQHRQQKQQSGGGAAATPPPQTPHTLDCINKIQDIQRDVLELMAKVEQFGGRRLDKEYAYLDEMLTRNLLKLDTIDTNGKDSIRLARKEAIKCIEASINVLEAKAEENARSAANGAEQQQKGGGNTDAKTTVATEQLHGAEVALDQRQSQMQQDQQQTVEQAAQVAAAEFPSAEPIPLPPPEGMHASSEVAAEQSAATNNSVGGEQNPPTAPSAVE